MPFSRTKGYEVIELGASTSQSKPGLPRFADVTQVETQSRSSVSFGISATDLSNLNEVLCDRHVLLVALAIAPVRLITFLRFLDRTKTKLD